MSEIQHDSMLELRSIDEDLRLGILIGPPREQDEESHPYQVFLDDCVKVDLL